MTTTPDEFRNAMRDAGLAPPPDIAADGRLHRFPTNGQPRDRAGWYVLHGDDPAAGAFGDWRTGVSETWRARADGRPALAERRNTPTGQAPSREARLAEVEQLHAVARRTAKVIWDAAQPAPNDHPYLDAKGIASHGLRVHESALLVPLYDGEGLSCLQFIQASGEKRFLPGGCVAGCHFLIGAPQTVLCVAEGYATAASLHEATGQAVAIAFNASNLLPVAQRLRARFPAMRIVVCADDDVHTVGNPGLSKAREAALAIGAYLAVPDFGTDRPERASDFNDLHQHAGLPAVHASVEAARPVTGAALLAHDEWPEPKPIHAELRAVPPFDADTLLPEPLRSWVIDEAERMPCPPDFIAAAALVALGSVIGARCAIKPKSQDSWLVVPNLWGGVVGDPSTKKTPSCSAAFRPLDRLIGKAREYHADAQSAFELEKFIHDAQTESLKDQIKKSAKGGKSAEIAVHTSALKDHGSAAPAEPILRRYKTNDCTVEKLGELLRDNPQGLLAVRDELVGMLASWDKLGRDGERAFFLEAWTGTQSFDTDRIGRGHISISNLCVSVFGGIQPDKLIIYLEQAQHALDNDGLLQRFQVLVYPDKRIWEWRNRAPDMKARDAAFALFEALADFDPVAFGAAPASPFDDFPCFMFSTEAQDIFIEWSRDLHQQRIPNEDEPLIQQHLAKYDKLLPALALIFHLVDGAALGVRGPVSKSAALRAAAWCEILEAHARRCYGLLKDDGLRAAQVLAAKLQRGVLEDGFTARDVRRHQWRNLKADDAVTAALDWLEDEGWLRGESVGGTGPGTGRRTCCYSINPRLVRKQKGGAA